MVLALCYVLCMELRTNIDFNLYSISWLVFTVWYALGLCTKQTCLIFNGL